ncbi:MAG: hypothetical protein ACREPA_06780 [Candidatus Dormibacteraceae bacterium]
MEPEDPPPAAEGEATPLERLQIHLDRCPRFPPGYPVVLADRELLLDLLDDLRAATADPIADARRIEEAVAAIVADARSRGERIEEVAERRAAELVRGHPMVAEAQRFARDTEVRARRGAARLLHTAEQCAAGDLAQIAAEAEGMLVQVRRGKGVLEARLRRGIDRAV